MDLKLLLDSFGVTWGLFWGPPGLLRASGRLLGSELLPGVDLGGSVSVQGFILGVWGSPGLHFGSFGIPQDRISGSFGRLRRLLGALGVAPRAPRAAWMSPGGDFGFQMGAKREPKSFQNRYRNWWKINKQIRHIFNGFLIDFECQNDLQNHPKTFPIPLKNRNC